MSALVRRVLTLPRGLRTALAMTVLACLAPAALTGCTGDSGTNPPTPSATASVDPAANINPEPRTMLAEGGELRLPVDAIGQQWNPLYSGSSDSDGSDSDSDAGVALMMGPMLPRLFNYDADGNPSPNPDYLAAVNASGGNPQVVTYTLSPNAVWNSGRAMSADDFIAEWHACDGQNVSFKCNATSKFSQISGIKQGTGPNQVVVTYKGAYADWPDTFDVLLPKESDSDPATFNKGWTTLTKIENWLAGPFTVSAVSRDDGVLIETPNPQWWADKPKLSQLTFRVIAAGDRFAALRDHQIDAYDLGSDLSRIKDVNGLNGCEIREAEVPHGKPEVTAARRTLANYGSFGNQSIIWTDVGYLQPAT